MNLKRYNSINITIQLQTSILGKYKINNITVNVKYDKITSDKIRNCEDKKRPNKITDIRSHEVIDLDRIAKIIFEIEYYIEYSFENTQNILSEILHFQFGDLHLL